MNNALTQIISRMPQTRIAVIGDIALDEYISGSVSRSSPEAPVVIVHKKKTESMLGCAGNVAANLRALGAQVYFLTVMGNDRTADELKSLLKSKGINYYGVFEQGRITPRKTRIIGEKQHVVRIDDELIMPLTEKSCKALSDSMKKIIKNIDIIIISDYEKGLMSQSLAEELKKIASDNKKRIIVDPKPKNAAYYKSAYLIKPNKAHASEILGEKVTDIAELGVKLCKKLDCNIIITRGPEGMTIFEKGKKPLNIPTEAKKVYDVVGAGDTVNALLAASLAAGATLEQAARIANIGAGIVISKPGTATATTTEILDKISYEQRKIKTRDSLSRISESEKHSGRTIVWTNGCFDILHPGHIRYLQSAKKLGDILIVGLNSDSSDYVRNKSRKLINNEKNRAEVIAALEFVDYVLIFDEAEPSKAIQELKPDICAKGENWKGKSMPEEKVIKSCGGKIQYIPLEKEYSTKEIVNKIKKSPSIR